MKLKLGLLDRWTPIDFDTIVDVALTTSNFFKSIGSCKIIVGDNGNHYGELQLKETIDSELYLYYRIGEQNGVSRLYGLDFMENQHKDRPTIQIKDAIVIKISN